MTARKCKHEDKHWSQCRDGHICLLCIEGVCPDCRKLWREVSLVTAAGLELVSVPQCKCATDD